VLRATNSAASAGRAPITAVAVSMRLPRLPRLRHNVLAHHVTGDLKARAVAHPRVAVADFVAIPVVAIRVVVAIRAVAAAVETAVVAAATMVVAATVAAVAVETAVAEAPGAKHRTL